jgi:hypothetical protein
MKLNINASVLSTFCLVLLSCLLTNRINAQNVTEPPIPVYIVCPYHEDSLRTAFESSLLAKGSPLIYAIKKYDTLQMQIQKSSAESSMLFTWLYALIALLGTMNILLLFSTSRIKKELVQIKRLEHYQKLAMFEHSMESQSSPHIQEALFNQEQMETNKPTRTRKVQTKKPRTIERN